MWTVSDQCVRRRLLLGSESVASRDSPGSVLSAGSNWGQSCAWEKGPAGVSSAWLSSGHSSFGPGCHGCVAEFSAYIPSPAVQGVYGAGGRELCFAFCFSATMHWKPPVILVPRDLCSLLSCEVRRDLKKLVGNWELKYISQETEFPPIGVTACVDG